MTKILEFVSASISLSHEYSGLISLKTDWFDLLAVQGTLRSLLQHHSLKASVLRCYAFFIVQFSQLYVTTGKTRALTIETFVGRVMSLLFNIMSMFVMSLKSVMGLKYGRFCIYGYKKGRALNVAEPS